MADVDVDENATRSHAHARKEAPNDVQARADISIRCVQGKVFCRSDSDDILCGSGVVIQKDIESLCQLLFVSQRMAEISGVQVVDQLVHD